MVQVPNVYNQKDELKSRLLTQASRYLLESCHQILVVADYLEKGHKNMNKTFLQHHEMNQCNFGVCIIKLLHHHVKTKIISGKFGSR